MAPPAGYPPPAYGYGYPPQAPAPGYNGMAIAALVLGAMFFYGVGSILAIIFSLIAKRQIAERGERGAPMATAGLVLGIIGVVGAILVITIIAVTSSSDSDALALLRR